MFPKFVGKGTFEVAPGRKANLREADNELVYRVRPEAQSTNGVTVAEFGRNFDHYAQGDVDASAAALREQREGFMQATQTGNPKARLGALLGAIQTAAKLGLILSTAQEQRKSIK